MEPERLGKYEIRGTLGKGAMGTVYRGWDPIISREVAIKTVRLPDASDIDAQEELQRFKREAQAAGRLTHPNIVGVFDYGETPEVAFIVMEFVSGQTLKAILDNGERMTVPVLAKVMGDLLAGLQYSHERGVVHRDIKPANVMIVGGDGHGSGQAKIADFGIARIESSNLTQAGTIMGTPAYMSPEQFMGQTVDARTDIYSSGVLLFQLLTGERPFEGSMATIMHKALNTQPPKPSELSVTAPRALDAVVARAMSRRPEDRFATAGAFAEAIKFAVENPQPALEPGLGDLGGDATVVSAPPPRPAVSAPSSPAKPRSRVPLLAGGAAVVVLAAGAGAWFALAPPRPTVPLAETPKPPVTIAAEGTPSGSAVVAVTPPTSPPPAPVTTTAVAAAPIEPAPIEPAPTRTSAAPPVPEPRPAVTQVVPPATANQRLAVPGTLRSEPAQIVPPASGPPAPLPQTVVASHPVDAAVPAPEPQAATPSPALAPTPSPVAPSPPTTSPVVASAGLSPETMRRAVAAAVHDADCAAISGDLSRSGVLTLRGVAGPGEPVQALLRTVREAAPDATLDWAVDDANGPYCGALNAVHAYTRPFAAESGGMGLALKDGRTSLKADDTIDIRPTLPAFSAFLQLDYFSSDGSVAHVRTSAPGNPALAAHAAPAFVAGAAAPPFGTDLIVAVASSTPLFAKGQTLAETADAYVRELRTALEAAARRRSELAASVLVVRTAPKS